MKSTTQWDAFVGTDDQWDNQLLSLSEPCVYQSSSWAKHRADFGWQPLRFFSETNRCYAQVLHKTIFGTTIAWIPGGPTGEVNEINKELVSAIRRLTKNSRVFVRINLLQETDDSCEQMLKLNQWHRAKTKLSSGLSLIYKLNNDEPTRRNLLSANWGRNLRRGESRNHEPYLWRDVDAAQVAELYQQLSDYKELTNKSEVPSLESIKSLISNCQSRLSVFRCDDDSGKPLAIRGALVFGDKAWDILAAVSPQGRKQYSSYVTAWALLTHFANSSVSRYDLSGIDPVGNKGVYDFKHGVGSTEIKYIGEWDCGTPAFVQPVVGRLLKYRNNL